MTEPTAPRATTPPPAYTPAAHPHDGGATDGTSALPGAADVPAEVRIVDIAPKVVSPAWELELLISGAVTFGLLQLPAVISDAQAALLPKVTGGAEAAVVIGGLYARATVYALLATFLLNLVARAYWVGLVGLQSVYPGGPRWSEYKSGPFLRELYQQRLSSLPRVTARVDDFASVLFSFGFLIAMVVVLSSVGAGIVGALAWALARVLPGAPRAATIANWLFALLAGPMLVIATVDKYVGPRLRPDGAAARALRLAVRFSYAVSMAPLFGPVFITLFTNLRRRTFYPLFYTAMVGALGMAGVELLRGQGAFDPGVAVYAPADADLRGVHAEHYESLRRPGAPADAVTIQADMIDDPYVRLFIPYQTERLGAAVPRACPGVETQRRSGLHLATARTPDDTGAAGRSADRVLACVTRLYAVTLDGRPVPGFRLRFGGHAATGTPGFVGYIPMAGVPPGEHVLRVARLPNPPKAGEAPDAVRPPLDIPFWR